MLTPHPWLGLEFCDLLREARALPGRIGIAVTRPSGRSYGEGALRVVRVLEGEEGFQVLLAYEGYRYPPRPEIRKS